MREKKWSNTQLRRELRSFPEYVPLPEPIKNAIIEYIIFGGKRRQNDIEKAIAAYGAQKRKGRALRTARKRRAKHRVQASLTCPRRQ